MSTPPIIIVSEPDPMISGVLRVEFSRWDFAVLLAADCLEAEDYAAQAVASLIVLDAGRSRLRAFEACARIRHRRDYAHRPIVLTVNEITETETSAAAKAKATALLAKPYSVMDLFRAVTPHLPANDPLLLAHDRRPGAAAPPMQEWTAGTLPEWRAGRDSALSRNGLLLPIVRSRGMSIPLARNSYAGPPKA